MVLLAPKVQLPQLDPNLMYPVVPGVMIRAERNGLVVRGLGPHGAIAQPGQVMGVHHVITAADAAWQLSDGL